MRHVFLALAMGLLASTSNAKEPLSFDVMLGNGALICDLPESVVTALQTNLPPSDCGIFRARNGMPVTVTIIGEYDGKPLAQFDFHVPTPWGNDTQYGWWAGELPETEPPGEDA